MKHAVVLLIVLAFLFMPLALLPLLNGYVVVAADELLDLNTATAEQLKTLRESG